MKPALTRRQLVIGGVQATAMLSLASLARARRAPLETGERALVVVQLSGGNDALNMLVPHRQDAYVRARPTLALPRGALHRLDDDHGFHPEMGALARAFGEGFGACVHSVGYPSPDRSHFRAMEIWHTAEPDAPAGEVGWLGRIADQISQREEGALVALHVGAGDLPLSMRAESSLAPSVADERGFRLAELPDSVERAREAVLGERGGSADLAYLRDAARTTYRAVERMQELAERPAPVEYPGYELARRLKLVARLIDGGFGTRIFAVELGGFDTHARQAPVHAALLRELSESLAAFTRDLAAQGALERVAVLVFSEFGRRVEENGSKGTDHGAAAPVLLVGGGLRAGVHGTPPDLSQLAGGDVAATTDFRSVYAALERDWLGLAPSTRFAPVGLVARPASR
jgi:uncharacterized protein (DUF1501 family)